MQIPFNADEINLIYQFGKQSKIEMCASLSAILPQVKDCNTKQIVSNTLKKLNALSEETCAELTAATKRRKLPKRDHSIKYGDIEMADRHGRCILNTVTILFRIYPVMRITCRIARKNCIFLCRNILNWRRKNFGNEAEQQSVSNIHLILFH